MLTVAQRTIYVDAYSGAILGEGHEALRRFMSGARAWHRWLAMEGDGRQMGRAFTGCATAVFLFILCSGFYLWFPRSWTWQHVRPVVFFKRHLRGRARDFNWHNTIGAWSVVPLIVIVLCAMPMSFTWANAAVYRVMGDEPPRAGGDRNGGPTRGVRVREEASAIPADVVDAAWRRAMRQEAGWKTITYRVAAVQGAPLTFGIDRGTGGQPQLRSTLTVDHAGHLVRYETFADVRPGARLRAITRFAHTGEILGLGGQTVAGLATAGAAVLVLTGFSLAIRRLRVWMKPAGERPRSAAVEWPAA
jgi:uncharacterized iron-regulated membrane protein